MGYLGIHISMCNLRLIHCYNEGSSENSEEMTFYANCYEYYLI